MTLMVLPSVVAGSEISIRPFLIDETLSARDSVSRVITVKSDYEFRKSVLYATVNEITVDKDGEIKQFISPVMTDRTNTVTSWVQISRGRIEVPAHESREVPLTIKTHPFAEPGEYHVFIGIVEAPNRPAAQAKAMSGDANGVILKVTVSDERRDSVKIVAFTIDRFVTGDNRRTINIELENLGDLPASPTGEIIFYDSRGIEVSSLPVSSEVIVPGGRSVITNQVPLNNDLGRYKANLSLKYGTSQTASLFDTTFFYLMPLRMMLVIFAVVLALSLFVVLLFRRAFVPHEENSNFDEVTMYVRDGHEPNPKDHDIDLKNN
jgi:hypothetical protein